jgi:hypothetical protein
MSKRPLDVWSIREAEGECKAYWKRIGRAFVNHDGSINVLLDALPIGSKLQIREMREREDKA